MKKICVLFTLLMSFTLTGCEDLANMVGIKTKKLETPVLSIDKYHDYEMTMYWDKVSNAVTYNVKYDGVVTKCFNNYFSFENYIEESKEITFSVQACGNESSQYNDSDWSTPITISYIKYKEYQMDEVVSYDENEKELFVNLNLLNYDFGFEYEGLFNKKTNITELCIPQTFNDKPVNKFHIKGKYQNKFRTKEVETIYENLYIYADIEGNESRSLTLTLESIGYASKNQTALYLANVDTTINLIGQNYIHGGLIANSLVLNGDENAGLTVIGEDGDHIYNGYEGMRVLGDMNVNLEGVFVVKGGNGVNGDSTYLDGTNGNYGLVVSGDLTFNKALQKCEFYGGNGGKGKDGIDGVDGKSYKGYEDRNAVLPGSNGGDGTDGQDGGKGGRGYPALVCHDLIVKDWSNKIHVYGGTSGNGGKGGDAGDGGQGQETGGWLMPAGDGGRGGNGGKGGNVTTNAYPIYYYNEDNAYPVNLAIHLNDSNPVPGKGGKKGEGGAGGIHSGRREDVKFTNGFDGTYGRDGIDGNDGIIIENHINLGDVLYPDGYFPS